MSRVLITGGAGFIGQAVAGFLAARPGVSVVVADNLSRGRRDEVLERLLSLPNVSFMTCDLTDSAAVAALGNDFSYIYHLAAVIGVKNVMACPERVLDVNARTTINLLEHARRNKALEGFFFSSTSEVYAGAVRWCGAPVPTPESTPMVLEDITQPRTTYALSKMFGESACFVHAARFGVPVVIGRFHNVYGPRMGFAHVIPETFVKIARGGDISVPSAEHTRAFCFVEDAVDMTVRLTESPQARGQVFNIGNPTEETSIEALVRAVARVQGRDVRITALAPTPGSPARRCPDISRWEALFGKKEFVPLVRGLERTYAWYKDRLDKPTE